jgi:hypothetical protein
MLYGRLRNHRVRVAYIADYRHTSILVNFPKKPSGAERGLLRRVSISDVWAQAREYLEGVITKVRCRVLGPGKVLYKAIKFWPFLHKIKGGPYPR